jgi:nicotinamidase-related amidase
MPVTALDARTALVVIDLQNGVVSRPTVHDTKAVVAQSIKLVEAFRARNLPVVLVNVRFSADFGDALRPRTDAKPMASNGPLAADFFELIPELNADPSRDIMITKRQWGAFYGTSLDLQLRRRGITGIVMCGIATSIGVESTARDAYELGYNQTFAIDAMTDMFEDAHQRAVELIFPRMGEVDTTDNVLRVLEETKPYTG